MVGVLKEKAWWILLDKNQLPKIAKKIKIVKINSFLEINSIEKLYFQLKMYKKNKKNWAIKRIIP